MSIETLQWRLTRILRAETVDHPLMADAIKAGQSLIDDIDWDNPSNLRQQAEALADFIEDWAAYHGEPLRDYILQPWLSEWRKTCLWALRKSHSEIREAA